MSSFTNRQKEIIDVSIGIIAQKGIQHLTIKNISGKMGISEPAIYRHFDSKIDILLAILSFFKDAVNRSSEEILSSKTDSIKKIESIFFDHFSQFSENPAIAAVIFSEEIFRNDRRLIEQVDKIMQINQKMIMNIIVNGQLANEIRNDIPANQLSIIVLGALRLLVSRWRLSGYSFDLNKEGSELWISLRKIISVR